MSDDLKFRYPFSCIVIETSGSGKASFCIHFLQIVGCYGEKSAVLSRYQLPANVRINEGVPEDFGNANGEPCLVILNDSLNDVYSKQVCELFTRRSHHRNISVF